MMMRTMMMIMIMINHDHDHYDHHDHDHYDHHDDQRQLFKHCGETDRRHSGRRSDHLHFHRHRRPPLQRQVDDDDDDHDNDDDDDDDAAAFQERPTGATLGELTISTSTDIDGLRFRDRSTGSN